MKGQQVPIYLLSTKQYDFNIKRGNSKVRNRYITGGF